MESGYVYNPSDLSLEHYYQEPADYDWSTYDTKEASLKGLADCSFSYSDGQEWKQNWEETNSSLPKMVKLTFRFEGEDSDSEFIVNIPISQ